MQELKDKILWLFVMIFQKQYKRLIYMCIERCSNIWLNGFQLCQYYEAEVFNRLGLYIGHELCYEASAAMMMAWRGYEKSRYVFVDCKSPEGEMIDHAWVEIKAYGIWWTIDAAWLYPVVLVPRWLNNLFQGVRYTRIIPHEEFWQMPIALKMYENLKRAETSYLLYELKYFRPSASYKGKMMWEAYSFLMDCMTNGRRPNLWLMEIFSEEQPVTQRIVNEFMAKRGKKKPKRKSRRQARSLMKKARREIEEKILQAETSV